MEVKETKGKCVVCGGKIVETFEQEFNAKMGPMIIGPGSRQQFHKVSQGYHCEGCGIKYAFIPGRKEKALEAESKEEVIAEEGNIRLTRKSASN